jgi:protein disulfide-isomerase
MNKFKIVLIALALVFILATGCNKSDAQAMETAETVTKESNQHKHNESVWIEDYDEALAMASVENKEVLINFSGSDWCGWCIKLEKEVFSKEEFLNYAKDNFILLKLDFPNSNKPSEEVQKVRQSIAQKYKVKGFPTILITDAKGVVSAQTGYQAGGPMKYIEHLKEITK